MKVIILAAGIGSRLGNAIPKTLTPITGANTILDLQVQRIRQRIHKSNIVVVVGYREQLIRQAYPELTYIVNPVYEETNTAYSLFLALRNVKEDIVWMNGDIVFDKSVLALIHPSSESVSLVDVKECGPEEMKYSLDKEGNIVKISKQLITHQGEALGINRINASDLTIFKRELQKIDKTDYFEKALENLAKIKQLKLKPVDIGARFCHEIDTQADLEIVQTALAAAT